MVRIILNRSPRQWAQTVPEKVCAGSQAQVLWCIRDAIADIAALVSLVKKIEAKHIEKGPQP